MELSDGRVVFTKSGRNLPPGLLGVEAEGLRWLAEPAAVSVPSVIAYGSEPEVLVLEWIEPGPAQATTFERLGHDLAPLHASGAPTFGGPRSGYIGSVPQSNEPAATWPEFWITRRISPFVRQATAAGSLPANALGLVDRLAARLPTLAGPPEPPARVHGDLWSGNVHVDRRGVPWLVDPAAHGAHREVDLAMLSLFGSPTPAFFAAYNEAFPLAIGWQDRLPLWQLEPLLAHTILFGAGYAQRALAVLRQFSGGQ